MPVVQQQQQPIFYTVSGTGFPLVLLHGFCEDLSIWEEVTKNLNDLQIICIDLPGFGQSGFAPKGSIDQMAEAVKAVLDELQIESCLMGGHSMGGYVTLAFAEHYPQYLKGFGLFHSHAYADTPETADARDKSRAFIQKNGPIYFVKQLIPKFFPPSFLSSHRYLSNRLIFNASRYPEQGIINGLTAMKERPDRRHVLEKSAVPVLFILGEEDELIPLEKQIEQSALPSVASVHILPKVGHMGPVEAPRKMAQFIRDFCRFCLEE